MREIGVIIPVHNEEKTILGVAEGVMETLENARLVIVDDGSTDKSIERLKGIKNAIIVRHVQRLGLAQSFRDGLEEAMKQGFGTICVIDADGEYDPTDLKRLVAETKENDLVLGSRFMASRPEMSMMHWIGNKALTRITSRICGERLTDAQTGIRAFKRAVGQRMTIRGDHTYTQESIICAKKNKFKIKEVPISYRLRKYGTSKVVKNPLIYAIKVAPILLNALVRAK